ncbi:MAG: helix-turn-helix domain-containing protein [archaeon]|nr:helix-turn-helix domain-containing protein [archaeon]
MDEVSLTNNEFKALSSKTRTNLLKMLHERNYTLSELASKSGMAAPTVKQHTTVLVESGLIELKDEGRKWKYYALTGKGKKIIESEQKHTNILIILSSTIFVVLIGFAAMFSLIGIQNVPIMAGTEYKQTSIEPIEAMENTMAEITAGSGLDSQKIIQCFSKIENIRTLEEACAELNDQESCESYDLQKDGFKDCKWQQ